MPAEWEPHERCLMAWPARESLWGEHLARARADYAVVARAIAAHEPVLMFARAPDAAGAREACPGVEVQALELDDSWMRDTGPLFVRGPGGELAGADPQFNGWGGKYVPFDRDAAIAARVLERLGVVRRPLPLVLEGGAITVDGDGTLITTESVMLHPDRNPGISREQIEAILREHLGAERVIWLAGGLVEDRDTDGHVDNVCHFLAPGRVLVQTCRDPSDPDAAVLGENLERLRAARDARGRRLEVVELPFLPRLEGVRPPVAVPYTNLYLANGAAIVPVAGGEDDEPALALLARALPERRVVAVPGATLARGGGGVHCITQQQPVGGTPVGGTPA